MAIVVTGANGYVASHLVHKLISESFKVVALVRSDHESSAEARMVHQLDCIDPERDSYYSNLTVHNYVLTEKDFGINTDVLESIFDEPVDFFHFAACLKYHERSYQEIFTTNVKGCENALSIFYRFHKPGSRFFYISSAYSCGIMSGVFEEKFYPDAPIHEFRNLYEQSKRYAENVVQRFILENKVQACVIRLAQVIGNSITGETLTDYGIFDFVKRMSLIARKYPNQTVRVRIDPDAHQNLVPVDYILDYFSSLIAHRQIPSVIHFVNRENTRNNTIISCLKRFIPIRIHQNKNLDLSIATPLERLISGAMSFTGAYTNTRLAISFRNLDQLVGDGNHRLSEEMLCRMIGIFTHSLKDKFKEPVQINQKL